VAEYQVVYWREIPAMVTARAGRRDKTSVQLPDRFQEAIDDWAMRLGLIGTDAYLEQWRRGEWQDREGTPETVAAAVAAELDEAFPPERLREMVHT
jgi:hypothetical protein